MFGKSRLQNIENAFAEQFEADASHFLYRKGMKAAPVRVDASEREKFIEVFRCRIRYLAWAIFPGTILLIVGLALVFPDSHSDLAQFAIYAGIGLLVALFLAGYYWAWNAPARELAWRPVVGEALSREQLLHRKFARITYGQLALAPVIAAIMLWSVSDEYDVFQGWGIFWLILAAAIIVSAAVQAFRKWHFERS
ncbi:MAG: hypothetical protein AB7E05_01510 [Sphingobium sp.]